MAALVPCVHEQKKDTPPTCSPGYYVANAQAWDCSPCASGSTTFSSGRPTSCTACAAGTYAAPGACNPCDTECDTCEAAGSCTSCAADHTDAGGGVCVPDTPIVAASWPRVTAAQQATFGDGSASFTVQVELEAPTKAGGSVFAVALSDSAPTPTAADVIAGTDGAGDAAAAAGSVAAGAVDTLFSITLTGDLVATGGAGALVRHSVFFAFRDLSPQPTIEWWLGGASGAPSATPCAANEHCAEGLKCVHPAGVCAPDAPAPAVVDVYFDPPPAGSSACDATHPAIAAVLRIVDEGGFNGAAAPATIVEVSASPEDDRAFSVRPVPGGGQWLTMSGAGEGTYTVTATLVDTSTGGRTALGGVVFTVSCPHLATSASGCAGSSTCGIDAATVTTSLRLTGYDAAQLTADDNAGLALLAAELASELGVAAGAVEVASTAAAGDGSGTDVELAIHLPESVTSVSGRRMQAAVDASAATDISLAMQRRTLFNSVARLVRRGVAVNIADGVCCTATMTAPRLARPVASVQSTAADGPVAFVERDVPAIIFTVANAPTSGDAVTTLWLAWTMNDADPDPVPAEGTADSATTFRLDFAADSATGEWTMPTAPDAGGTMRVAAIATTTGYVASSVWSTQYTWADHTITPPAV